MNSISKAASEAKSLQLQSHSSLKEDGPGKSHTEA